MYKTISLLFIGALLAVSSQAAFAFDQKFDQLYLRGTSNGWGNAAFSLVDNHTWQVDATFGDSSKERFKIDVKGDWSYNIGDDNDNGWAKRNEDDIAINQGAGDYRITFNDDNFSYSIEKLAEGNRKPEANAGSDIVINMGESAQFDGSLSSDSDGTIATYSWSNNLDGINASLVYETAGTYSVTLTVTDNEGASDSDTLTVSVVDPDKKESKFTNVYMRGTFNGWGTAKMVLVANNTWQLDADFGDTSKERFKFDRYSDWAENYGDTNTDGIANRSGADIKINEGAGIYRVTFNDSNLSYSLEKLPEGNRAPTARAGDDIQIIVGQTANFDGSASTDSDGTIASYSWDNGINVVSGSKIYDQIGTYTVTLTVIDNEGASSTDSVQVVVQAIPKYAPVANAGADINLNIGETAQFDASNSTDSDGTIATYSWSNGLEGVSPEKVYSEVNTFTVTLTVTDNDGLSSTDSLVITVVDPNFKESKFEQVYVRGTNNGWGTTAMVLVDDNSWQLEASFGESSTERFKFDILGDWSQNYGDDNNDGFVERTGENIGIKQGVGTYLISFNDKTMFYTVERLAINIAPVANAGGDIVVAAGEIFTVDGSASYDPDGFITDYLWSTGATTAQMQLSYHVAGIYSQTLTVTDSEGETHSDTISIDVRDAADRCKVPTAGTTAWMDGDEEAIWNRAPGFYKEGNTWYVIFHTTHDAERVQLVGDFTNWNTNAVDLNKTPDGKFWWFKGIDLDFCETPKSGDDYKFRVIDSEGDSQRFQDPAARWQEDTKGYRNSRLTVSADYQWNDQNWERKWENLSIYEMHALRFTSRNSGNPFQQITEELNNNGNNDYLNDLNIGAIQLMPIAAFPYDHSWGYNPTGYYYAVENAYGSPEDLKKLVDTAHQNGIAVILDVVYNHNEDPRWNDNILAEVASDTYLDGRTIWGPMTNFDNDISRHYFAQNALYMAQEYHIDGFRLDATRVIHTYDNFISWAISEQGSGGGWDFLRNIRKVVKDQEPGVIIIAEELPNDWYGTQERINDSYQGDWHGPFDSEWADWFGEEFAKVLRGDHLDKLNKVFAHNFGGLGEMRGDNWQDQVIYIESHDEVGNHDGRIAKTARSGKGNEMAQVGVAGLALSRGIPMLFMGQESAEERQFLIDGSGVWDRRLPLESYETDSEQSKVLAWSQKMFEIRHNDSGIFAWGGIEITHINNGNGIAAFTRDNGKYLIVLNFKDRDWSSYGVGVSGTYKEIANTSWPEYNVSGGAEMSLGRSTKTLSKVKIPAYGAVIFKRQ